MLKRAAYDETPPFKIIDLNVNAAGSMDVMIEGTYVYVYMASDPTVKVSVAADDRASYPINLYAGQGWRAHFKRLFFSWAAQPGQTASVIVTTFERWQMLDKRNVATPVYANQIFGGQLLNDSLIYYTGVLPNNALGIVVEADTNLFPVVGRQGTSFIFRASNAGSPTGQLIIATQENPWLTGGNGAWLMNKGDLLTLNNFRLGPTGKLCVGRTVSGDTQWVLDWAATTGLI